MSKLLLRRLTTFRGEFPHLPEYGLGVRAKELFTSARLPELRAEIVRQLSREPGVTNVSALVSLLRDGQLHVAIRGEMGGATVTAKTTLEAPYA